METSEILEKINTCANILDKLRADLINQERNTKRTQKKTKAKGEEAAQILEDMNSLNQTLTVRASLEKFSLPTDQDFTEDVSKFVVEKGMTLQKLESVLERVKYANDKSPKNDIKKYVFSCLHNSFKD